MGVGDSWQGRPLIGYGGSGGNAAVERARRHPDATTREFAARLIGLADNGIELLTEIEVWGPDSERDFTAILNDTARLRSISTQAGLEDQLAGAMSGAEAKAAAQRLADAERLLADRTANLRQELHRARKPSAEATRLGEVLNSAGLRRERVPRLAEATLLAPGENLA